MADHIESCAQLKKRACPSPESMHGEPVGEHWWSGWPGACCLKCFANDPDEFCIGTGCKCPCHDEFWKEFEAAMQNRPPINLDGIEP